MNASEQRDLVRRGYDHISEAYRDDSGRPNQESAEDVAQYRQWIDELSLLLPKRGRVLDLGCGNGLPASRLLTGQGFEVTGVDFSAVQIRRARQLVPRATFIQADMALWECPPESFDAVVTLYAIIHVPLIDQPPLLKRIYSWLRPTGYLVIITGEKRWTGVEDYLGGDMFWDHEGGDVYRQWLTSSGFTVVRDEFIPEGTAGHRLFLAQR